MNKKSIAIIVALVLIIAIVGISSYLEQKKIEESNLNFITAQKFEGEKEYEKAIEYYSLVIEQDEENYNLAKKKEIEIAALIDSLKKCAKAIEASERCCNVFDISLIEEIYSAEGHEGFESTFGREAVNIIMPYKGTACSFIVSYEINEGIASIYPNYYDEKTGLYILAIGIDNYTYGWLSAGYDRVSDKYVEATKEVCVKFEIEDVLKYVEK